MIAGLIADLFSHEIGFVRASAYSHLDLDIQSNDIEALKLYSLYNTLCHPSTLRKKVLPTVCQDTIYLELPWIITNIF